MMMHRGNETHFKFEEPVLDPIYFSLTTTTTTVYGQGFSLRWGTLYTATLPPGRGQPS